jgi:hypothetical protein
VPREPAGSDVVEILITVATVRLICPCAEQGPPDPADASVTCAVKVKVPKTVGVPVMAPELLMVNPEGKAPPIRAQVSVPAPPLACTVAL